MTRRAQLGALLLGAGIGILVFRFAPPLAWLWPLALVAVAVMSWRSYGPRVVRSALLGGAAAAGLLSVSVAMPSADTCRVVATYGISSAQRSEWFDVERVVVRNHVGEIRIQGSSDDLGVSVAYGRSPNGARVPGELLATFDGESRTLFVTGIDPDAVAGDQSGLCATIELRVPESAAAVVTQNVGDVRAARLAAAEVRVDVGRIEIDDIAGSLDVRLDVGTIDIENVLAGVEAVNRVGDVRLTFDRPVGHPIHARTDVGDVHLLLPSGSNATVRATSDVRKLHGDLQFVTASEGRLRLGAGEHEISLGTRVGEVRVKER